MPHLLFEKHKALLAQTLVAIKKRGYWSPFAENVEAYGENALEEGRLAFEAYRDAQFYLDQPGVIERGGAENSPYGLPLNISYPKCHPDALISAGRSAMSAWIKAGPDTRAGICVEMLERLNSHSAELAHAVMHTTGQGLGMAFRTAGAQSQNRGLEAIACAYREMKQVPETAVWEKNQGNDPPMRLEKIFTVVPRGIALVIGCSTFPTWNAYPGIFASLVTGNPVIVKPHPSVILPLALTVAVARQTLKEAGFDPNLVSLLVDDMEVPLAREVALRPEIRCIDFTGGPVFGAWLEENARQAMVFTEKAGVNCVIVDSTDDYPGLLKNLAFSLALYSGQMCTAPQAIFVAKEGVKTAEGVIPLAQFEADLARALNTLLSETECALEILGAIQSLATMARIEASRELGEVLVESTALRHPQYPEARVQTPLLIKVDVGDMPAYAEERFGPISFIVETTTTLESLSVAERVMRDSGALTFLVHSTAGPIWQLAEEISLRVGVALTFNLTDTVYINQTSGFSDYHGTGANPAANACLIDSAFVAGRFFVVQSRHPL
ncbi:MAG: phenylacetic acid degradation protein PaaN [Betaproteobacteria bacterium]|nr:phenylacetic acid degradation protein PaaN [Betaproteobacteria bacterium]